MISASFIPARNILKLSFWGWI